MKLSWFKSNSNGQTGHEIRRDGHRSSHPCPHPDCRRLFSTAKNLEVHLTSGAHDNACLVCDREDDDLFIF